MLQELNVELLVSERRIRLELFFWDVRIGNYLFAIITVVDREVVLALHTVVRSVQIWYLLAPFLNFL